METFSLFVPMKPTPKGRPRMTRVGHVYTPQATVDAERTIRGDFLREFPGWIPWGGPINVRILFRFNRPKSKKTAKFCVNQYDVDNLAKSTCDSLNGIAWLDDRQIVHMKIDKVYTEGNELEGVLLDAAQYCNATVNEGKVARVKKCPID